MPKKIAMLPENCDLDVTVLIPTYKRAEGLRETLESMCRLRMDDLEVEFVVIDNNSPDDTKAVVRSFSTSLPVRYIFEGRPGKSCALNCALEGISLGRIVVFTDDDVSPNEDWIEAIVGATKRWPRISVFGGRILPRWPDGHPPEWARFSGGHTLSLGVVDFGEEESPYPEGVVPGGPNFWVMRNALLGGRRFDESIGPRPTRPTSGEETIFVTGLVKGGHKALYFPHATVIHRVQPELLSAAAMRKRAWAFGLGGPHHGLCRESLLKKHPYVWLALRVIRLLGAFIRYGLASLALSKNARLGRSLAPLSDIAYNIESLAIARRVLAVEKKSPKPPGV